MHNLGLMLDVDGPISSPVSRTIAIPSIAGDLVALAAAGVPIAFVTGRSDAFARERLVPALFDAGLAEVLRTPGARMFGVFEKGGVWAPFTPEGLAPVTVDESVVPPPELIDRVRMLVERYADTMFFDETKRAMISVEQSTEVSSEAYLDAQQRFDAELAAFVAAPWVVESTIIASDVQSERLTKDHAVGRALEWFRTFGPLPSLWRSVGDSPSDYRMADRLHAEGLDTAHVDVRPAGPIAGRPYPVLTVAGLSDDAAGAEFLRRCVAELALD